MADKRLPLGMNRYRNVHYQDNNRAKIEYKRMLEEQRAAMGGVFSMAAPVHLIFELRVPNKTKRDLDNWCIIHSKFFGDALVELGYLEEDTGEFINRIEYVFRGMDKENPRVDIYCSENNAT